MKKTVKYAVSFISVIAIVALAAIFMGQGPTGEATRGTTGGAAKEITVRGSTTVLPVASAAAEEFNSMQDEVKVAVSGGGSSVGIKTVATGSSDIGDASREVKQVEVEQFGDDFVDHKVAFDGIAVIVSEEVYNSGVTDLNLDQVKKIYNGEIENWKEVGGPDEEIFVNEREEGSGTREVFMGTVGLTDTEANAAHSGNSGVRQAVGNADNAVGYVGLGYVGGNVKAVKLNSIEPTEENVAKEKYPIYRALHMYTWGRPDPAEEKFLDFVMGEEGQKIAEEEGFIPIS